MRESLFALLSHNDYGRETGPVLPGARTLDACAGTGALGLEALSRSATHVTFFDVSNTALKCVKDNIAKLGAADRASVCRASATKPPDAPQGGACDLVLLDPPYQSNVAESALTALVGGGWLARDAIIVIEHGGRDAIKMPAGFAEVDHRTYGTTAITLLRYTGGR